MRNCIAGIQSRMLVLLDVGFLTDSTVVDDFELMNCSDTITSNYFSQMLDILDLCFEFDYDKIIDILDKCADDENDSLKKKL